MKTILTPACRRFALIFLVLALVGSVVFVAKSRGVRERGDWIFEPKPGPWGKLECVRIAIEMPETFISLDEIKGLHAHWFFRNQSRADVENFLKSAGLSGRQLQSLIQNARWENDSRGCWISPGDESVLGLPQATRQKIYTYLAQFPENEAQHSPFIFRMTQLPEILEKSDLHKETIAKFRQLLYTHNGLQLFCDTDVFVNHLPDEHEKVRFLKTISRTSTLLVKLKIDSQSDLDSLVDYWSYGGRKKDVRALLESMAAVPGGSKIDIAHLLPAFVRQRIYSYPPPSDASVTNHHCHWTSMNFLNSTPDERFSEEDYVRQTLQNDFVPVTGQPQLGDVIFFMDKDGMVIHSATFIADNIVFTKNGGAPNRPWIYMEMQDLISCYMKPDEPLRTVVFRRKA